MNRSPRLTASRRRVSLPGSSLLTAFALHPNVKDLVKYPPQDPEWDEEQLHQSPENLWGADC